MADYAAEELGRSWLIVCEHLVKKPDQNWNEVVNRGTQITEGHLCDECVRLGFQNLSAAVLEPLAVESVRRLQESLTLGDGPIENEYAKAMVELARFLDHYFNGNAPVAKRETGFVLLVFKFAPFDGRCNYISNGARREDIVTLLREQIARFEGMPSTTGHA